MSATDNKTELRKTFPSRLVLSFLIFTVGIIILGLSYYESQRKRIFTENRNYLTAISKLKTGQIEEWHNERLGDAAIIKDNGPLIRSIIQYFNDRENTVLRKELTKWMESVCREFDYTGVTIIDTLFKLVIDLSLTDKVKTSSIQKELKRAMETDSVIFSDLHRTGDTSKIHIDLIIPLTEPGATDKRPFCIVILRIDPLKKLYPLIQSWPTPSRTSETLLLRREGDSILYLNELHHRKNSALNFRMPLSSDKILGVKAVKGFVGVNEGVDYRNIPVIGYLNKINGLDWYMVTKVDREELLAPVRRHSLYTLIVTVLLVITNALIFGFWIWGQRVRSYKNQLKNEMAIREGEEKFNIAFRMSPVSITITSMEDNKFIDVNNNFINDIGYSREQVLGKTPLELDIWANEEERQWVLDEIKQKGKVFGKVLSYKSKTGEIIYGLSSMSVVTVNGKPCNLSTVVNVTDSIKSEEKIKQHYYTLKGIIESSRGPIFSLDTNYCYTSFNQVHAHIMKFLYSSDIQLGKSMLSYQTNVEDRNKAKGNIDRALAGEFVEESAWSGADAETRRYFEVSHNPIFNDINEVVGVAVNARDQTERKKVEEALYKTQAILQAAMDQSQAGIAIADAPDGKLRYVNDAGLLIHGGDRESATNGVGIDQYVASWHLTDLDGKPMKADEVPLARAVMYGEKCTREFIIHRGDSDDRIVFANAAPIKDDNGLVISAIVVFLDITEIKHIEKALTESENKFRTTFDLSPVGVVMVGFEKQFLRCNKAFADSLGYAPEELTGKTIDSVTFSEDQTLGLKEMKAVLNGEIENSRIQKRYVHKDGHIVWGEVLISLISSSEGIPQYFLAIIQDITESKKAIEALRESEDKFKYVFDHSLIGKSITLPTGEINVNTAFCKMVGYSPKELSRTKWKDISFPDDIKMTEEKLNLLLSGKRNSVRFIKRYIHKNGSVVWADVGTAIRRDTNGNPLYFVTAANDITELKKAEEELSLLASRQEAILSSVPDIIMEVDNNKVYTWANKSGLEFFGEDVIGKEADYYFEGEQDVYKEVQSLFNGSEDIIYIESWQRRKDGEKRLLAWWCKVLKDLNGDVTGVLSSAVDITKRKEAEEEIRESENRFTLAMKASNDGLYDWNLETNDIYYSPGWKKMLGYADNELPNDFAIWEKTTDPIDVKKSWELQQKLIAKQIDRFVLEFRMKHKDGHWVDILSKAEAIFNTNGKAIRIVGTHTDITLRKQAEEQIQKLNAELEQRVIERTAQYEAANKELEAFSYSVSHDLRAPLRAIHGYTKILLEEYENKLDEEGKRLFRVVYSSASQMGELIDDLLSFSRIGRSTMTNSLIDMKGMAMAVFNEMNPKVDKRVVKLKISKLNKAFGDSALIKLVWTNLISNSLKYTSRKETSEITIGSKIIGESIVYHIKDNGVGFDMLYKHKLFGVFQRLHSEKEFEGNGVGLAIIQRIIHKHGGKVWAEGEVGKGATFYFSLPVQDEPHTTHDSRHKTEVL